MCFEHCSTEWVVVMFNGRQISTFVMPQCTSIGHKCSATLRKNINFMEYIRE